MAMSKDTRDDAPHGNPIGHSTEFSERKLVFNRVDDQGPMFASVLGFAGMHAMALSPVAERSAELPVAEAVVPVKVINLRNPGHTHG
jgi:hypothetical protein